MSRSRFWFSRADPRASTKAAALFALAAPLVLGSCIADSVSLRISCNLVPDDDCTYSASGSCYLDGELNVTSSVNDRYHAVLLVSNGLKPRAREVPPQSEPNGVTINQLEIEVTDSAGRKPSLPSSLPNPFTVLATGDVKPGEDAPVGAELLPRPYVLALRALNATSKGLGSVRLSIILRGKTWGGVDVEAAPWPWSVQLVSISDQFDAQECVAYKDQICTLGQDKWVYTCNPATVPTLGP
jgi:hypothetical protein